MARLPAPAATRTFSPSPIGGMAQNAPVAKLDDLAVFLAREGERLKASNDTAAVEEAYNQIMQRQQELTFGDEGFSSIRGGDAYRTDIVGMYGKKLEDSYNEIIQRNKLTRDQQEMLRPRYHAVSRSMNLDMLKHKLTETSNWRTATAQAGMQVQLDGMLENLYSPNAFMQYLPRYMGMVEMQADAAGMDDPILLAAEKKKAANHVLKLSFEKALADGNLDFAKSLIEGPKDGGVGHPLAGVEIDTELASDMKNQYRVAWDRREAEYEKLVKDRQELETARLLDGVIDGSVGMDHLRYAREKRLIDGDQYRTLANARMSGYDDPLITYDLTVAAHRNELDPRLLRTAVELGKVTGSTARTLLNTMNDEEGKKITSDPDYKFVVDAIDSFTVKSKGFMESFEPTVQQRRIDALEELRQRVLAGESPMAVYDDLKPRLLSAMENSTPMLQPAPRLAVRSQDGKIDLQQSRSRIINLFATGQIQEDEAKRELNRIDELTFQQEELDRLKNQTDTSQRARR